MLGLKEINRIAKKAASATLKGLEVTRVFSEPGIAFDGSEILNVTIVLRDFDETTEADRDALDTIMKVLRDLQRHGEDRFPVLTFATEADLAADVDPSS